MTDRRLGRVDRLWLWWYTAGMAPDAVADREAELVSDAWEHGAYDRARGRGSRRTALERMRRAVAGIPDDVLWRIELGRRGFSREGLPSLVAALLLPTAGAATGIALVLGRAVAREVDGGGMHGWALLFLLLAMVLLVLPGFALLRAQPVGGAAVVLIGCVAVAVLTGGGPAVLVLAAALAVAAVATAWRRRGERERRLP